jgi:hypothetical protein
MVGMAPYTGASNDLGLGAQAAKEAQDEIDRIKKKKLQDQKATGGQAGNQPMSPNTAAFLSLSGNQF